MTPINLEFTQTNFGIEYPLSKFIKLFARNVYNTRDFRFSQ